MKQLVLSSCLLGAMLSSQPALACVQGYVWREALHGDHVCVTAQTRQQAWNDNAQADARRLPGSDTCKQGYVWREATRSDHVCVTPATRADTWRDNDMDSQRQ